MVVEPIQNIIDAHVDDQNRIEGDKLKPQIKVSKAASFLAVLYEKIRNSVDYEEDHLLRKRALKRIMLRMDILAGKDASRSAESLIKEIILAQYMNEYPIPEDKIAKVARIVRKYQFLLDQYQQIRKQHLKNEKTDLVYGFCAFEIERELVPYTSKDAVVNAQYYFLKGRRLLKSPMLDPNLEPIQTYIAIHRANTKSDDEMIAYKIFLSKYPHWQTPTEEQVSEIARGLDAILERISEYLDYRISRNKLREVVRQSIPFKILDKVIIENLGNAQFVISDDTKVAEEVRAICEYEYTQNRKKLRTTTVRTMVYIFITKIMLALLIEVPYEIYTDGHINFFTLGINVIFPAVTLFLVANSFSIPSERNTMAIIKMVKAILTPQFYDDNVAFEAKLASRYSFKFVFQIIYLILFFMIFSGIIYVLYLLNFNIVGMFIFLIFFSTILFAAVRIRNTASELKVIETRPSVFAPLIDMVSVPILIFGKRLSEGAKNYNVFIIILDFIIEAPFKSILKVFEEWSHYIRETREEIV